MVNQSRGVIGAVYPQRVHSTWSAVLCVVVVCVTAIPVTARAETGYDAWLRYAPLPKTMLARAANIPRTVTLLGDSPVLRSARDELVRGLSAMLASPVASTTSLPASSTILLGTLDRVGPVVLGAPSAKIGRAPCR